MRTFFVIALVLAWFSPLSGEELKVAAEGPGWRMASVGRVWAFELPASGGKVPLTWTLLEGVLPPGIHLVDLSTVQWGSPSRMGFYGVAAEPGQWRVKVGVSDSGGGAASAEWMIEVSPLALENANAALEAGVPADWRPAVSGAAGTVRCVLRPEAYLPLGLTLSREGVLGGQAALPGRYEIPVELSDETGRMLRTTLGVAVYGKESSLPPMAARIGVEGLAVSISLDRLPETAWVDVDWGDGNGDPFTEGPLKHSYAQPGSYDITVVATLRDGVERVEARYSVTVTAAVP